MILNVVDRLEFCDFALPAKIRRGDLLVTFSTNGKSPALSRYLRCKMEREFDETYANWLDKLVQLRKEAIIYDTDSYCCTFWITTADSGNR